MNVTLSKKTATTMARTLRTQVPGMTHSYALETVSKMFGHPNWDTLSRLVKSSEKQSVPATPAHGLIQKPITFYLSAAACGDTSGHPPEWAKVVLTQDLLNEIWTLHVEAKKLGSGIEDRSQWELMLEWQPYGGHLRLGDPCLVATVDAVQFTSYPRHQNCAVETHLVNVTDLISVLRGDPGTSSLGFAHGMLFADGGSAQSFARRLLDEGVIDINEVCIDKMTR